MDELIKNVSIVLLLIILFPLVVAFFRRKQLYSVQQKIAYLIAVHSVFEICSYLFWQEGINNHPLYHFYAVVEFWLVLNIYRTSLEKWLPITIIVSIGLLLTLFAIVNSIFFQDLTEFNSNVTTVSGVLIILFSLISFFQLLTERSNYSVFTHPQFYINSGFLIYFSSNLVLFYLSSRVELSQEESYMIWGAHAIVNCVLITFYTIALWIQPKEG